MSGVPTSGSVPDELASAVRRAATTVPDHGGELATVRRRWRTRRRRQAALTAGSLACLVAATALGVPALTARPAGDRIVDDTAVPLVVPPQRLLLPSITGINEAYGNGTVGLDPGVGVAEVRRDGSLVRHPVPAGWFDSAALPDGRLVGLRAVAPEPAGTPESGPGAATTDGPDGAGLPIMLVVLRPDGAVAVSREVRTSGGSPTLLGADDRDAYLFRDDRIVRHELATGRETPVLSVEGAGGDLSRAADADLSGRFLALPYGSQECGVRILDLDDGRLVGTVTGEGICYGLLRLSPDGQFLAVAALPPTGPAIRTRPPRVTVYETSTGTVRVDQLIEHVGSGPVNVRSGAGGLAWLGDNEVRVARVVFPAGADRIYRLDEVLHVVTVPVGR
ncbi:hypothetical protein [Plantactinospora sp. B5E13]|uniref:hypothetical protein n=1 Tax=unclassified Plantactinospora TaxID=2631981 RepID=UPI00325EB3B0